MENDKDPDWLAFLRGQNAYARSVLDQLPARKPLLERIQQLSGDITAAGPVRRAGGRLFYQQRPAGADNYKLFVREVGKDRALSQTPEDPSRVGKATEHRAC